MYLQGFWDFRSNRRCQGRRLNVDMSEDVPEGRADLPFIYPRWARSFRGRLALDLCVRHSGTYRFVHISRMDGFEARVWLLGRASPTSRTVAPNLWSFGRSELRKLPCPELMCRYLGASADVTRRVLTGSIL
ncbi:hypothetical protein PIB30_018449 [Stylosanthes scabra]|uniref:Uncharacterized protein n=1 Tax=Stylosanthes scabra TaxID=79078 RepID=A0ABU6U9H8_9FABA|nr:hypothetical protein [Stylosanthes scabra]